VCGRGRAFAVAPEVVNGGVLSGKDTGPVCHGGDDDRVAWIHSSLCTLWSTPRLPPPMANTSGTSTLRTTAEGPGLETRGLGGPRGFQAGAVFALGGLGVDLRPVGWLSRNGVLTPLWRAATALASLSGGTQNREYESWLRAMASHPVVANGLASLLRFEASVLDHQPSLMSLV
jgi:hypothetical protein